LENQTRDESLRADAFFSDSFAVAMTKTSSIRPNHFIQTRLESGSKAKLRPSILVVQNTAWEGPGLIAAHARATGESLVTVRLFKKARGAQSIPFDQLEKGKYSALVALGSPSTAYRPETNPRHDDLVRLFKLVRRRKIPSFDICYSMQLFSIAHGGKVGKSPVGKEVGFRDVDLTPEGKADRVFGPIGPHRTLEWHGDVVEELPQGAVLLGSSKMTKNQVAVLDGIHYLVQSDAQAATPTMVRSWMSHDGKWATKGTGVRARDVIREAVENEVYLRNTFLRIFGNFLALVARPL
jgi:GMP synthase-like glutamine amidotransferase